MKREVTITSRSAAGSIEAKVSFNAHNTLTGDEVELVLAHMGARVMKAIARAPYARQAIIFQKVKYR